jgi:flagellar biogenesis protein FliO
MSSFWQWFYVILLFLIIIGVLLVIGRYGRRWLGNFRIPNQGKQLKVIDSIALDFKTHLFLVSVGDSEKYLIVDNGNNVHILKTSSDQSSSNDTNNSSLFEAILKDADSKSTD